MEPVLPPLPPLPPAPITILSCDPLTSELSPSCFSEAASRDGYKIFQDTLFHMGTGAHMGFLLLPPYQNVFQNSPKNADGFLSSDLWKAIKDTGKADNPLSFDDWEWQWRVCVCVCAPPPSVDLLTADSDSTLTHLSSHLPVSSPNCLLSPAQR